MLFRAGLFSLLLLAPFVAAPAQDAQPFINPPQLKKAPSRNELKAFVPGTAKALCPAGDISQTGNVVSVHLEVREDTNEIYNPATGHKEKVKLRSYGGCLSGPELELEPGSTLRVHLVNNLDFNDPTCPDGQDPPDGSAGCFNTINMHFHGLHVSPSGNSDNVLLNIAPQTSFDYEINIPGDHPAGTFWYHAHRHGSTAAQVASGASGALIIRGKRPYLGGDTPGDLDTILHTTGTISGKPGPDFPELIFLFQQIPYACFTDSSLSGMLTNPNKTWWCPPDKIGVVENFSTQLGGASLWDVSGRFTSINGAVQPQITQAQVRDLQAGALKQVNVQAGAVQHWRMIHAGIHDTINLQIVPMVAAAKSSARTNELQGVFTGSPKDQAKEIAAICPTTQDPKNLSKQLVPQFEVASDGLTRTRMHSIGIKDGVFQTSLSGGVGTNFMQPGYRSDILLVFPRAGTYCVLNQAAALGERESSGAGGQGTNMIQLLATVQVVGDANVTGDPETYIRNAIYDGNKNDGLPPEALSALGSLRDSGDLTAWRGMPDELDVLSPREINKDVQRVEFNIGNSPFPVNGPPFTQAKPPLGSWVGAFGFYVNNKVYDPNRVDFTRQVGTTDDWELTALGEPHIFHIHVNPFEIMDVLHKGKSIFGDKGKCLSGPDSVGLENQYCGMWHTYKDTVFVEPDYKVLIRTRYDRYIGEFVIHCHILDHEDSGMMTNVQIVPNLGAPGNGIGMPGMKHSHMMMNNPGSNSTDAPTGAKHE